MIFLLMMNFYNRALALIKQGCPLSKITALSVKEKIVRLKSSVPNDKLEMMKTTEHLLDEEMSALERTYKR